MNFSAVTKVLHQALVKAGFDISMDELVLTPTKTLEHGHFAVNIALPLAKKLGKNPREVAEAIVREIKSDLITRLEIAGPGFINLWIEQKFYTENVKALCESPEKFILESLFEGKPPHKTMVIEYSSPNIAKPLGVHHLLSTIIGDSLKRLYRAYGYNVIGENYPGDIGTQFGKLIYAIKTWGDEKTIEKNPIDELLRLYVHFHNEAEKDPSLEDCGRAEYKAFEEGDAKSRAMHQKIVQWSMAEIQPLYDRLGVSFDGVHGESFFEECMKKILKKGREEGVFVDGKEGAWIIPPERPEDPPAIVRKSDGTTIYLTRDLAQMEFFEEQYHPDFMVWVVDVAQSLYFRQRFHASRQLKQSKAELVHVIFGRMEFKEGGMSTRKGNIIKLQELLDEAEERALKLAQEKGAELSPGAQKELARIMGIGSVKYNILSQNRLHNMMFDWDTMLSFDGNSAPYLMYTATRAQSILKKAGLTPKQEQELILNLRYPLETQVALDLTLYPQALERAAKEFKPNHLASHLYRLTQDFNAMYNDLPVLNADSAEAKSTRLLLTLGTLSALRHGLGLLDIEVPEKM